MIVPELVLEGPLGALVLRDFILQRCQRLPEIGVVRFGLHGIHRLSLSRRDRTHTTRLVAPDRPQPPVAAAPGAIHPIASWIFLRVILVVLLRWIERTGREDHGRHVAVEAIDDLLARSAGGPALLRATNKDRGVVIRPGVAR